MSRIDEIKKVVLDNPAPRDFELAVPAFKAQIYIEHLLSRLEIAEKALMKISGYTGTYPEGFECGKIAKDALQQIRS